MKRAEIITALLEQARDKDTLANYDPNSIFTFDANVLTEAALMLFAVNDWVSVKDALPPKDTAPCTASTGQTVRTNVQIVRISVFTRQTKRGTSARHTARAVRRRLTGRKSGQLAGCMGSRLRQTMCRSSSGLPARNSRKSRLTGR